MLYFKLGQFATESKNALTPDFGVQARIRRKSSLSHNFTHKHRTSIL